MKVPCSDCGVLILQETADRSGGRCSPCRSGTRSRIEASKAAAKRERELDATDPTRIYWRKLVDLVVSAPDGLNCLSEVERQYWAVGCLSGEVYNGGFEQYFHNSSGSTYNDAVKGLEAMGALASLILLQKAKQVVFGFRAVPEDTGVRRGVIASIRDESHQQRLDELDKQFWVDPDKLAELSQNFAVRQGLLKAALNSMLPQPANSRPM